MTHPTELAAVRERLSLPLVRRVWRALAGVHPATSVERGFDLDALAPYVPGTDVTAIDWAASSRAGETIARRYRGEQAAPTIVALDVSSTMRASAPSGETKIDVARDAARIIAYLASLRGDPFGLLLLGSRENTWIPPRAGNAHAEASLRAGLSARPRGTATDMVEAFTRLDVLCRKKSLIIAISDLVSLATAHGVLARLASRHTLAACLVSDRDPATIDDPLLVDVTLGILDDVVVADPAARAQARRIAAAERDRATSQLAAARVPHVSTGGTTDTVDSLYRLFTREVPRVRQR